MQLALPPRGTPRPCGERTSGTSGTPARQHTHEQLMRDARTAGDAARRRRAGPRPSLAWPPRSVAGGTREGERVGTTPTTRGAPNNREERHAPVQREQPAFCHAGTQKGETGPGTTMSAIQSVQVFGRKKAATAVAYCKQGRGLIKVNGCPIELLEPEILRLKTFEPVLLLGQTRFANVDIRIRVKGGGFTAQIYAIRQAIAKSLVAYYQKYVDEASKTEIRDILMQYDRTLLVADPRRCESKKFGGPSARARYQKSYR